VNPLVDGCPKCGGGLPGDDRPTVCQCGSAWARKTPLKRGGSLKRTSGLKRGAGLKPGGALKRAAPIRRMPTAAGSKLAARLGAPKSKPKRKTADDIPPAVRAAVLVRAAGCCEACGKALGEGPVHLHHRQKRNGRNHTVENLVALHPTCHVIAPEAVHQRPIWAKQRGLILLAHHDPAVEPLTMPDGRRVLLGEEYRLAA
jgi:hypothetical protein